MEIDALSQLECPSSCPAEIAHGDGLYHMECRVIEAEVTVVCVE
jgi:hypothetical protein